MAEKQYSAAQMVIDTLKNNGVEYVFGIPGAKIDYLFNALEDDDIELVVTRHEQNAAMIAQGIGRLTGKPGVAITTSGPGVSNLTTGLLTATSEGDPVLAIGGQVKRNDLLRLTHQSIDNASLLRSSTKYSAKYKIQNHYQRLLRMQCVQPLQVKWSELYQYSTRCYFITCQS